MSDLPARFFVFDENKSNLYLIEEDLNGDFDKLIWRGSLYQWLDNIGKQSARKLYDSEELVVMVPRSVE